LIPRVTWVLPFAATPQSGLLTGQRIRAAGGLTCNTLNLLGFNIQAETSFELPSIKYPALQAAIHHGFRSSF
jgi:hypothetical protein